MWELIGAYYRRLSPLNKCYMVLVDIGMIHWLTRQMLSLSKVHSAEDFLCIEDMVKYHIAKVGR